MDNFTLSSKVGDKWTKVTSDMTSVKLGTCIHIVGELSSFGGTSHGYLTNSPTTIIRTRTSTKELTVIFFHTQLSSQ
jgi:hypothetical protein